MKQKVKPCLLFNSEKSWALTCCYWDGKTNLWHAHRLVTDGNSRLENDPSDLVQPLLGTLHPLNLVLQPASTQATLKGWGHIFKIQISKVNILFRGTQQGTEFSSNIIISQAVEFLFISKATSLPFYHFTPLSEHRFLSFVVRYKEG